MANGKNKDHVSFWFWFFALFVTAIPCIGWIMIIVWAFVGQNESRKNYYKAVIAWILIGIVFWTIMMVFGISPLIDQKIHSWIQQHATNGNVQHAPVHK